jgi:hypothetical protein
MLAFKTSLGALLCGTFFVTTGPALLFQQATSGRADDVAELMPADVLLFAEFTKAPAILKDWRDYVGAVCTAEGKTKLCDEIEKAVKKEMDIVPEKLLADLEKGLPSVQRLAVALMPPGEGDDFSWLLVATSSDADFFKKLVDEDLKIFAFEERVHGAAKVQAIRKMGEIKFGDPPLLVTAVGNRLLVTTSWPSMCAALDRAAGKGKGDDLRKHPLFARFSAPATDDPTFRAFAALPFDEMFGMRYGEGVAGRSGAHQLDKVDSVADVRKIRGVTIEASFKPGQVASRARLHVDAPCKIFEVWRQAPGSKELVKHIPDDAQAVAHINLKSGAALWEDIKTLINRACDAENKARPADNKEDFLAEFRRDMERHLGVSPDDLAPVIGSEAAFAMVGENAFASERDMVLSILVLIQVTDAEKAKALIERWAGRTGAHEQAKEGDATLWVSKQEGEWPSVALDGTTALFAGKADTLRAAIKAKAAGGPMTKRLPAGAADASKLAMIRHGALWRIIQMVSDGKVPDYSKDLNLEPWSAILMKEEATGWTLSSQDPGIAFAAQAALCTFPIGLVAMRGGRMASMPPGVELPVKPQDPPKDPPVLPADKLAAEVKKHVADLRSEEMTTRTAAKDALKALGKQAAPLIVEAVKKETDLDAKENLMDLLVSWKVYDAFPELLARKVDAFVKEVQDVFAKQDPNQWGGGFVQWQVDQPVEYTFPYSVEPYYVSLSTLKMLQHADVLTIPDGVKMLAERVTNEKLTVETQRNLAAILGWSEGAKPEDSILAARAKTSDNTVRIYLQVALGGCTGAKAREALVAGFKDANRWVSRASFIAAERTKDPDVAAKLLELSKDADHEVRWNASFTFRLVTDGKAPVNVYLPDADFAAQHKAATEWWEKNKATWRR